MPKRRRKKSRLAVSDDFRNTVVPKQQVSKPAKSLSRLRAVIKQPIDHCVKKSGKKPRQLLKIPASFERVVSDYMDQDEDKFLVLSPTQTKQLNKKYDYILSFDASGSQHNQQKSFELLSSIE